MAFVIRKFDKAKPLGETLKALRKEAGVTMSELASKTKIRRRYLEALEADAYDKLPEPLYTKKFLHVYVQTLGGNETYFLDRFETERGTCDFVKNARLPRRRARGGEFFVASRFLRFAFLAVLALAVSVYIGLQIRSVVIAPALVILSPADGMVTSQASVNVIGSVDKEGVVHINGAPVILSKTGSFNEKIALKRGVNVITIEAKKRYSRTAQAYRRVIFEQPSPRVDN